MDDRYHKINTLLCNWNFGTHLPVFNKHIHNVRRLSISYVIIRGKYISVNMVLGYILCIDYVFKLLGIHTSTGICVDVI